MLFDGIRLAEGSSVSNMTIDSGTAFPADASLGELFYRTDENRMYMFNSTKWKMVRVESGTAFPTSPSPDIGDLFFKTTDETVYVYKTAGWTGIAGGGASGVSSFNTRTGSVTLTSGDVTSALTFTPYSAANPSGFTANTGTVTSVVGTGVVSGLSLTGTVSSSGSLTLGGALALVSADVTDALAYTPVNKAGDSLTGSLVIPAGEHISIADAPSAALHAANKAYVDSIAAGLSWKTAVKAASTANLTLSGLQTVDGVSLMAADRILVKNQTAQAQNGIYAVASGSWTRATDMDAAVEFDGSAVFVQNGTLLKGTGWVQTATVATVGSSSVVFAQFTGGETFTWGVGLASTGNTVNINLGAGIAQLPSDEVGIDVYPGGGLMITADGTASSTDTNAQLSLTKVGTAGSYYNVTTDDFGRVTAGTVITGAPSSTTFLRGDNTWAAPAAGASVSANNTWTAAQRGAVVALTPGATVATDLALSNNFRLAPVQNFTMAFPTNVVAGQSGLIVITQDGTGSRAVTWASGWVAAGGTKPILSTAANAVDYISYYVETGSRIFISAILDVK